MDKKWEKIISGFDDRSIKTVLAENQTNKKHLIKNSNTSQNSSNNMRWSK